MPKIVISVDTDVPAEQVLAAATDFTPERPKLWPNISPKYYEVHAQGANWAEVTEGTEVMGGIWARERYEWSPGVVRASVMDSNVFRSGIWEMTVTARDGGSHIEVVNHRQPKGKGRIAAAMMALVGRKLMTSDLEKTLEIIRRSRAAVAGPPPSG